MIALLSYSMNLFASNSNDVLDVNPPTGVLDSVMISYNDLRIVNSKLIELEYEKEINNKLYTIIHNDSVLINNEKKINKQISIDYKKAIKQRNICFGVAVTFIIVSLFSIIK